MDAIRLCLSLYACEPKRGSEPGVGWAWATGMAKRHETWVLTRTNNRRAIESELDRLAVPDSERPHFVWVDLPEWVQRLKQRGILPLFLYYLLWQFAARRTWDRTGIKVDVIHHVTFNSFVIPGVWWKRREHVVLGPLGGMSICPTQFLRCFSCPKRCFEVLRGVSRRLCRLNPFFLRSRLWADRTIYTTEEMRQRLDDNGERSSVLLETAVPDELVTRVSLSKRKPSRGKGFVWAGTLAGHKAGDLAIRAFALAFREEATPPVLQMFGSGPDEGKLKKLAVKLGVSESVVFRGTVPQEELWNEIEKSRAFVFSSVRDTSGNAALEALSLATPVICFNHQGVSEIVNDDSGIRVQPRSYASAVADFAAAMRHLADDPDLAERLGSAGQRRVREEFTWKNKFDFMDRIYRSLIQTGAFDK